MNQYIITKEHIHEILNILETEQYEKVHAVLRKLHPYQSEREKVLDVIKVIESECNGIIECPLASNGKSLADRILYYIRVYKSELRQKAGE